MEHHGCGDGMERNREMKYMKKMILMLACAVVLLCGCGKEEAAKDVNLSQLLDEMKAEMEKEGNFNEMMDLTSDDMSLLYGIETSEISQFAGTISKVGTNSDEILLLEVADGVNAQDVLAKLESRYQAKANEAKDYLPEEYEKIQSCEILQNGNYLALVVHSQYTSLSDMWKQAVQ